MRLRYLNPCLTVRCFHCGHGDFDIYHDDESDPVINCRRCDTYLGRQSDIKHELAMDKAFDKEHVSANDTSLTPDLHLLSGSGSRNPGSPRE